MAIPKTQQPARCWRSATDPKPSSKHQTVPPSNGLERDVEQDIPELRAQWWRLRRQHEVYLPPEPGVIVVPGGAS